MIRRERRGLRGDVPYSVRARRAWRRAAEQVQRYLDRYQVDGDGLGDRPHDLAQHREWRACHDVIDRLHHRDRDRDRGRGMSPTASRSYVLGLRLRTLHL